jgi:flagellar biosynthesis protein FlhB
MSERDQKTEQPTQRRVQKAREEGNFPSARIFVGALQFLAFVAMLRSWGLTWVTAIHENLALLLHHSLEPRLDPAFIVNLCVELIKCTFMPLAIVGGSLVAVTLAAQLMVTRMGFSLKKMAPDIKRLNPLSRIRQLPRQNLPALVQAGVMLPVFGWVVYALVSGDIDGFLSMPLQSVQSSAAKLGGSIEALLWKASCVFLVFGAVDLFRQKRQYQQDLRMTKQEIRDEMKEVEGSPLIKSRIRRLRRDMARRRMMHEVATATAVIVNPTHYAVALRYALRSHGAPKVVAKGKNYLALRIRQRAIESQVPLIENPPLAQALYKSVEVGQEIPAQFYRAVAEVLAYIYRLMNGRLPA